MFYQTTITKWQKNKSSCLKYLKTSIHNNSKTLLLSNNCKRFRTEWGIPSKTTSKIEFMFMNKTQKKTNGNAKRKSKEFTSIWKEQNCQKSSKVSLLKSMSELSKLSQNDFCLEFYSQIKSRFKICNLITSIFIKIDVIINLKWNSPLQQKSADLIIEW